MTRDAFMALHPRPFLVLDPALRFAGAGQVPQHRRSWSFKTVRITPKDAPSTPAPPPEPPDLSSVRVLELQQGRAHTWGDRISVGRAPNNDITLSDSSVSKLHACFTFDGEGVLITDMDSANGTRVGGRPIPAAVPHRLKTGDSISFGGVSVILLQSGDVYDMVREQLLGPR